MADMTVAKTILAQMGGMRRLQLMVGAQAFVGDDNSVQFGFKGCRKANKCRVVLEPSDTYRFELWKYSKKTYDCTKVFEADDVYCDMLVEMFESETGLYLTL